MHSAGDIMIETVGLHFAYGERPILENISLTVGKGEIVGLLGPNGSGKSTLLKLVAGLLKPSRGSIDINRAGITSIPRKELARQIAVVPQESTFSFPFSVLQVVVMGRHPHIDGYAFESEEDLAIARQALARCGAVDLAARTIHELSSGERQRVVFARALAQDPQILLLDEPASFLDIRHQVELYDIVRDMTRQDQRSVFTVLHDMNLAAEYCDRIYLLKEGRIQSSGSVLEVLNYANVKEVFNTEVYIDTNSLTGRPLIVPLSGESLREYQQSRDHIPSPLRGED